MSTALCSVAVHERITAAHCPLKCGSALKDLHFPLPHAMRQFTKGFTLPIAPCVALHKRSPSAHCPVH